jgi:antitoxin StbD
MFMERLLATRSVSITELKRSASAIIEQVGDEAVAVLNHNRPAAYLLPAATYEAMLAQVFNA